MALLCFTLFVQPDSIKARPDSNSRYLLVELDGSPDKDPGSDVTTEEPEMPKPEEEQTDDSEPETYYYLPNLPEDDEEGVMPEQEKEPIRRGYRNLNLTQSPNAAGEGSRSSK